MKNLELNKILEGRFALVTGGSVATGFGTAKRSAEEGAIVYITSRNQEQIK